MIIIAGTDSKSSSKQTLSPKRTTPTIYQKKKKVRGYVDRISNGIVVVVIHDPNDYECIKELYIPEKSFPKRTPEPGEFVTVTIQSEGRANRTTPTIYKNKKKVKGFVDRVSNGIVVVVIRDPEEPEYTKELYIPVSKFPKCIPDIGETVSVTVNY